MKKLLLLCLLFTVVGFTNIVSATNEQTSIDAQVDSQKETSIASIGFSSKSFFSGVTGGSGGGQSEGRLPTTGESVGMGLSFLGLLVVIITFRKELKDIIKYKNRNKGEEGK